MTRATTKGTDYDKGHVFRVRYKCVFAFVFEYRNLVYLYLK